MKKDSSYVCPACAAVVAEFPDETWPCDHTPEMWELARAFAACCCETAEPTDEQIGWYSQDAEETIAEAGPGPWRVEKLLTDIDRDDIRHPARRYDFAYLINGKHIFAIDSDQGCKEHIPPHYVCSLPVAVRYSEDGNHR